jgi:hypothetical protein
MVSRLQTKFKSMNPLNDIDQQTSSSSYRSFTNIWFSPSRQSTVLNQLVSAFTDDLNLPFNYEIVLDKDTVMLEAVERLFWKKQWCEIQDTECLVRSAPDKKLEHNAADLTHLRHRGREILSGRTSQTFPAPRLTKKPDSTTNKLSKKRETKELLSFHNFVLFFVEWMLFCWAMT